MIQELKYLVSILVALVLGFAIGYERKLRFKEAGIRTHTIVCVGSALMMVVSKYGFGDSIEADASRVAAQIVSGIGFLGAGIIIYRKHEIHGLTTAAGVWATAIIIAAQCLFHANWKIFRTKKFFQLKICFICTDGETDKIKELFQVERFNRLVIEQKGEDTVYHATLNTDKEFSSRRLGEIMEQNKFIRSIERCDEI